MSITVQPDVIVIHDLEVRSREAAAWLEQVAEEQRPAALQRALEVGVCCLQRANQSQDLDFVRREVEALLGKVDAAAQLIPGRVQDALVSRIGMGEGQVLAPVKAAAEAVSNEVGKRVVEVRSLLHSDLDPKNGNSVLGKALGDLKQLLDPARKDSIQGVLAAALNTVTAKDGALVEVVKCTVAEAIGPLEKQVVDLAKEVRSQEAAQEAAQEVVDATTLKGKSYEDDVVAVLQPWACAMGAEVEHVGPDNQAGDVLLRFKAGTSMLGVDLTLVIEARDRGNQQGRVPIGNHMQGAMSLRRATVGIYVSSQPTGLAREIGEWGEGECAAGRWIAVAHDHLLPAVRYLVQTERARLLAAKDARFDAAALQNQLARIKTALNHLKNIKTQSTTVRDAAGKIDEQADAMRSAINDALASIEECLRTAPRPAAGGAAA